MCFLEKDDGTEKGMRDEEELKDKTNKEKQPRTKITMKTRELSQMFGAMSSSMGRLVRNSDLKMTYSYLTLKIPIF